MTKPLSTFDFINITTEREFCVFMESVLKTIEQLDEALQDRTRITPTINIPRMTQAAIELIKNIKLYIDANNLETAHVAVNRLQALYTNLAAVRLEPMKETGLKITDIIKRNLELINEIMRRKSGGDKLAKFEPIDLPGYSISAPTPDYSKQANVGSGIVGANKIIYREGREQ